MVHCLEVLKALNERAVSKKGKKGHGRIAVPVEIALNPVLARGYANRRWTKAELNGRQDVYATYAASEREPFRGREGQREQLQH
jgi:hypothetical protein